jgi:hypothetical protein
MKTDVGLTGLACFPKTGALRSQFSAFSGLLCAFGVPAIVPLLLIGFGQQLHDGRFHQTWSGQVVAQLAEGGAQPRWLEGMNGGLGSPAMFFYPVLPYAVPVLARSSPGGAGLDASHSLALGVLVAMGVAGFAMNGLLRQFVRPGAALAGALLYVTLPGSAVDDGSGQ